MTIQLSLFSSSLVQNDCFIAGVDEAGRGPLCGDVFAAAVILDANKPIFGLNDSKKLSEKKRNILALEIKEKSLAWSISSATVEEIDENNILNATFLAMHRAVEQLSLKPHKLIIDGNQSPKIDIPTELIVKGDSLFQEIAAASILAKTSRDEYMYQLDKIYPQYGFKNHKGYGTKQHLLAISEHGILPIHRKSFRPIKDLLLKACDHN